MSMPEEESTASGAAELRSLAEAVCNGTITAAQYERLNALLSADESAARFYATYVRMHGLLLWHWRDADVSPVSSPAVPFIVETSPFGGAETPLMANLFSAGGYLFSYSLAALIVGIGLLVGWACQMPVNSEVAVSEQHRPAMPPSPEREPTFVGRITGMFDCQWTDAKTGVIGYTRVPLGRKYALASGLMEITYDSGARVILQGPCMYEVESRIGGHLSVGKLTARVGKRGERRGQRDGYSSRERALASNRVSSSPLSPLPSPLFSVRTPTVTITDLGTEFGVEVDKSGFSRTYVCEGEVELRPVGGGGGKAILLGASESARVEVGKGGAVVVVRKKGEQNTFVRQMPKSVPITLCNSGVGLKEGEPDSHWQVVARSDDPKSKPQPALVRGPGDNALENDPGRSQWLSLVAGEADVPEEVVYVFRTTFDLTGKLPSAAVLRGKFLADDRVVAIRLNGHSLRVPPQPEGGPFIYWTHFHAAAGFVKGTNVLDFEVLNADPLKSPIERRTAQSRVSCRVELEGEVTCDPGLDGKLSGKSLPTTTDKNTKSQKESKRP
jgi:hypothetical protein